MSDRKVMAISLIFVVLPWKRTLKRGKTKIKPKNFGGKLN